MGVLNCNDIAVRYIDNEWNTFIEFNTDQAFKMGITLKFNYKKIENPETKFAFSDNIIHHEFILENRDELSSMVRFIYSYVKAFSDGVRKLVDSKDELLLKQVAENIEHITNSLFKKGISNTWFSQDQISKIAREIVAALVCDNYFA